MRVILLAGGKGTRLYPYTVAIPKPLVPVGDLPIMEIIVDQLRRAGATEITVSIGHMGDILRAFIGDGSKFGVKVSYVQESSPLGTVGPLKQLKDLPERFILMNGDVLTDLDYAQFFAAHAASGADVLIASHRKEVPIDLGVMKCRDNVLVDYLEKPVEKFDVSMGIYSMKRSVLEHIPENTYFDFPTLIRKLLDAKRPIHAWPYSGHWLDLGSPMDYEKAQQLFNDHREKFLPGKVKR